MENINVHVALEDYLKIQKQLKKYISDLFELKIQSLYINALPQWIRQEYPSLENDIEDILFNVSRRLKNQIRKFDFTSGKFNLNKYYLDFLRHECQISLPNEENKSKNLGLTKKEYKKLLSLLVNGNEELIEKVYLKQCKICLTNLIRAYNCTHEEAYECTIDALYELRKDLIKNKIMYGNLASYFNRRAALVLFRKKRESKLETVFLDYDKEFGEEITTDFIDDESREMIKKAISKLGVECKQIIKQFYYEEVKLEAIAIELNKNHSAVRKQISRCRDKLRSYLGQDFYCQFLSNKG